VKLPLVSVGMCTFNNEATIIESIKSLQSQNYDNWELIIIDAFSSDNTRKCLDSISKYDSRIKTYYLESQQPWTKLTLQQLAYASGDYFMWLDADDLISSNWISSLLNVHQKKDCLVAIGLLNLIDNDRNIITNHVCSRRLFQFTSSEHELIRVIGCLLTPEPYGLVNSLYGLWDTNKLRNMKFWTPYDDNLAFDQIFTLETLKAGKVCYIDGVCHARRSNWKISKVSKNFYDSDPNVMKVNKFKIGEYLYQIAICKPPYKMYLDWIMNQKYFKVFTYFCILNLRYSISIGSPLVTRVYKLLQYKASK